MKKLILSLVLLLIIASPALAENKPRPIINSIKGQYRQVKDNFQSRVASKAGKIKMVREKTEEQVMAMKQKREEYQERFQAIKNERKQKLMETIDTKLASINTKATDSMSKALGRMSLLLDKLEDRMGSLTEIEAAREKIAVAQEAVEAQRENDYVMEFEDENGLKTGASEAKTDLRTDLASVKELVKEARTALTEALEAAKLVSSEE